MPYYNVNTRTIEGCRERSWTWWHERGHQVLHSNRLWDEYFKVYNVWWLVLAVLFLVKYNNAWAGHSLALFCTAFLFDEVFAWTYCILHRREWT